MLRPVDAATKIQNSAAFCTSADRIWILCWCAFTLRLVSSNLVSSPLGHSKSVRVGAITRLVVAVVVIAPL